MISEFIFQVTVCLVAIAYTLTVVYFIKLLDIERTKNGALRKIVLEPRPKDDDGGA